MDFWAQQRTSYLAECRVAFGLSRPTSFAQVTGIIERGTLEEIMDELFMADPESYRLLSEYVVLPDPEHDAVIREHDERDG